jgi:hypothetical protein
VAFGEALFLQTTEAEVRAELITSIWRNCSQENIWPEKDEIGILGFNSLKPKLVEEFCPYVKTRVAVTKVALLMLCQEIFPGYTASHTTPINTNDWLLKQVVRIVTTGFSRVKSGTLWFVQATYG